jgi:hypothetical protein
MFVRDVYGFSARADEGAFPNISSDFPIMLVPASPAVPTAAAFMNVRLSMFAPFSLISTL